MLIQQLFNIIKINLNISLGQTHCNAILRYYIRSKVNFSCCKFSFEIRFKLKQRCSFNNLKK